MKFNEKHKVYLQNTLNILRRCKLPDADNGEEYLAFAQSYYFIFDLIQVIDKEIKQDQQPLAQPQVLKPQENIGTSENSLKTPTSKKSKDSKE